MKVLFFTPFAQRNGAEMMLWYIIKNINPDKISCAVYSNYRGPLVAELPESIPHFTLPPIPEYQPLSLGKRVIRKIKNKLYSKSNKGIKLSYENFVTDINEKFKPDLWYINTVLCPEAVELAIKLNVPYAVHFHDLLFIYQHISYENLKNTVENASLLVGCSQIVCDKLAIMGGNNIEIQYECVDIEKIKINKKNVEDISERLNLKKSFVWIMSGSVEYRKGTDFVPVIARLLGESVTILWLGPGSSGYSYYVDQEIKYYGLNNVHMLGPKSEDYYDYLSLADGLVLTSREDPFPLVMIEAAAMGMPIAALNSGGVNEFVKDGMGIVVDSTNVEDLVEAMKRIMNDEINFNKDYAIKRAEEFDAKVQSQLWQNLMLNRNFTEKRH